MSTDKGTRWRMIYAGAAVLPFIALSVPYLLRRLWFDEALTIMNFALMESPSAIYVNYAIPNNHIFFSIVLHYWIKAAPPGMPIDLWCRLPSFICGIGMLVYLFRRFRTFCGRRTLFPALAALALGTPFLIYSTAVRGYMLGALLAVVAAGCVMDIAAGAGVAAWFGYVLASLGAVLTVPSDLCALAAAVLFALPMFGRRFYLKPEFYAVAVIPPVMLFVGYFPILHKLQAAMRLGEGWRDGPASLKLLYASVAYSFAVLIVPSAVALILELRRHFWRLSHVRLLIWLLPLPGACFFTVAPFPRVYFGLFPFFALLIARSLRALEARLHGRKTPVRPTFALALAAVVIWGAAATSPGLRSALSRRLSDRLGDDFFYGYYLRPGHDPAAVSSGLVKIGAGQVYLSFLSDPWAIIFYDSFSGVGREYLFDGPRGRVNGLGDGAAVVLNRDEAPGEVAQRFGCELEPVAETGDWRIFRVRK